MATITAQEAGGVIYALTEPGTERVRYVGRTIQALADRLGGHVSAARANPLRPVCQWILGLLDQGLRPEIKALEAVASGEDWQTRERHWIAHFRRFDELLNLTDGGMGWTGHSHCEGERRRIGAAHRGKAISAEQRAKQRAAMAGRRPSDEARIKISAALRGREVSGVTRARISQAKIGRALPSASGERNHRAVLTVKDVLAIRYGGTTPAAAKAAWGISKSQFYRVKRGDQWRTAA